MSFLGDVANAPQVPQLAAARAAQLATELGRSPGSGTVACAAAAPARAPARLDIVLMSPARSATVAYPVEIKTELGVKAELEIFDTGHLWFSKQMVAEGLLKDPLYQLCLGIPWGAPADTTTMKAMVDNLPPGVTWAGFGIGRLQMPMAAQAMLLGGHVRVGLEDNLWLDKGVPASNGSLVERVIQLMTCMGAQPMTPAEGRIHMGLKARA